MKSECKHCEHSIAVIRAARAARAALRSSRASSEPAIRWRNLRSRRTDVGAMTQRTRGEMLDARPLPSAQRRAAHKVQ
jgi:hypothetical protein